MTDVSTTIIVGEWTLRPRKDYVMVYGDGRGGTIWTDQQARDLAAALQVLIERNTKIENEVIA